MRQKATIGNILSLPASFSKPFQILGSDLARPLPQSSSDYSYIFTILDCFTKVILLFPLHSATASKITQILEEQIPLFRSSDQIIFENGIQFRCYAFRNQDEKYGLNPSQPSGLYVW